MHIVPNSPTALLLLFSILCSLATAQFAVIEFVHQRAPAQAFSVRSGECIDSFSVPSLYVKFRNIRLPPGATLARLEAYRAQRCRGTPTQRYTTEDEDTTITGAFRSARWVSLPEEPDEDMQGAGNRTFVRGTGAGNGTENFESA